MSYMIRKAEKGDLPRIYEIYETARQFMRENGNHAQWGAGDRPEELLEDDISQGNLYVLEDAVADEAIIHAVFAFIEGEDPVYLKIEQGSWMVDTELICLLLMEFPMDASLCCFSFQYTLALRDSADS